MHCFKLSGQKRIKKRKAHYLAGIKHRFYNLQINSFKELSNYIKFTFSQIKSLKRKEMMTSATIIYPSLCMFNGGSFFLAKHMRIMGEGLTNHSQLAFLFVFFFSAFFFFSGDQLMHPNSTPLEQGSVNSSSAS